jgi:hypothetical protein
MGHRSFSAMAHLIGKTSGRGALLARLLGSGSFVGEAAGQWGAVLARRLGKGALLVMLLANGSPYW